MDAAKPENEERVNGLLARVSGSYMFYPMVFINDEIAMAGSAEYYEVLYAVRDALGAQES